MEDVEVDCMEGGRHVSIARDIFTTTIIIIVIITITTIIITIFITTIIIITTCSISSNITVIYIVYTVYTVINNTKLIASIINMKFRRITSECRISIFILS